MILNFPTQYPFFQKGQPLRSSDLNDLIDYLEDEDLDTRVFLIGSGIFYGLELVFTDSDTSPSLEIKPGAGVSSDGYLLAAAFTGADGKPLKLVYTGIKESGESLPGTGNLKVHTLTMDGSNPTMLSERLKTKQDVVILRLKTDDIKEADCLRSYDNTGVRKQLSIEAIAAPKEALELIAGKWLINAPGSLTTQDPYIHRFGYNDAQQEANGKISFKSFTNWENIRSNFDKRCETAEEKIADLYNQVYTSYAKFFGLEEENNPLANMKQDLLDARLRMGENSGELSLQLPYYYDYLKDLVSAYQEFSYTGFNTLYVYPDKTRFAGYISLGGVEGAEKDKYRMGLYRPVFADTDRSTMERLRILLQRMIHMGQVSKTMFTGDEQLPDAVTVTPSAALSATLSHKAIPFYYRGRNLDGGIKTIWSYQATQQQRLYSLPGVDDATDKSLLLRDMDAYSFFRTQGYIGKNAKQAHDDIVKARGDLHLPFDIKLVFLGTDATAQSLIEGETAWFSDLGLLLEKVVNDIRCGAECGESYEYDIFKGTSTNMNIGEMFEELGAFFEDVTPGNWAVWVAAKCKAICNPQPLPALAAASENNCCPLHLKILFDLYTEYKRRKTEVLEDLFFHKFAEKHPGLEHNAGVPKGGTLVLVCAAEAPNNDQKEIFAAMLRNLKSLDDAAKATLLMEAEALSDYVVVADFCLPYTCCSKTPTVKIELRQVQPEADFEVSGQPAELPDGTGKQYKFRNLSRNANFYTWELFDYKGELKDKKETANLGDNIEFVMKYAYGVEYIVRLTASRGPLFQQVAKPISFCPSEKSLQLTYDGENSFTWTKDTEFVELQLDVLPYGGAFILYKGTGGNEWEPVTEHFTIEWLDNGKGINLTLYNELPIAPYRLDYTFEACEVTVSFNIDIEEEDEQEEPRASLRAADANVDITKTYNKRLQQYRKAVSAIGEEDKALAKTEKFGKTEAFLRFSGKRPELHNRYADLLKSLQTGMSNAGEKRQQQVADLVTYSTLFYLDRLLVSTPDTVPAEAEPLLQEAAAVIKAQPGGLEQLQEIWDAAVITNEQNSASINAYKALLS